MKFLALPLMALFMSQTVLADVPADLDLFGGVVSLDTKTLKEDMVFYVNSQNYLVKVGDEKQVSLAFACTERLENNECTAIQGIFILGDDIVEPFTNPLALTNQKELKSQLAKAAAKGHLQNSNFYFNEYLSTMKAAAIIAWATAESGAGQGTAILVLVVGEAIAAPVDLVKAPIVGIKKVSRKIKAKKAIKTLMTPGKTKTINSKEFQGLFGYLSSAT